MKKVKRFHDDLLKVYNISDVKVLKIDVINENYVVVFKLHNNYYYLRDVDYVNSILSSYMCIDYIVKYLSLKAFSKVSLIN